MLHVTAQPCEALAWWRGRASVGSGEREEELQVGLYYQQHLPQTPISILYMKQEKSYDRRQQI